MNRETLSRNISSMLRGIPDRCYSNTSTECFLNNTTATSSLNNTIAITSLFILVIGVLGNLLVLLTFISRLKQLSICDFFLLNLAVGDVMGSVVLPVNMIYYYMVNGYYSMMGQPHCQLILFLTITYISISALTLIVSMLYRSYVIRFPLRPQMAKRYLLPIFMGIWIMGCLPGVPHLVNSGKEKFVNCEICHRSSVIKLCTPIIWTQFQDIAVLVNFLVQVIVPLLTMVVSYIVIIYEFRQLLNINTRTSSMNSATGNPAISGGKQRGQQPRQRRMSVIAMNQMKNRQVTTLLVVLVSCFLVCVVPFSFYYLHQLLKQSRSSLSSNYVLTFTLLFMLQMINPCLHPFIYAMFHPPFKNASAKLLTIPCQYFSQLFRISKSNKMHYKRSNGDDDGYIARRLSRASYDGRTYSTAT